VADGVSDRGGADDPDTIIRFLGQCPAAPATLRRRIAAIDYHPRPLVIRGRGSPPRSGMRSADRCRTLNRYYRE